MNEFILFCIIAALVCGWIRGGIIMNDAKKIPGLGVPKSNNLWTFLFLDKY